MNQDLQEIRLMLVEDDESTCELVKAVLAKSTRRRWDVRVAYSAADAMQLAHDWAHIALVVIDFRLGPGMTGLDLISMLRRATGDETAMVIFTGHPDAVRPDAVARAGGVGVIEKTTETLTTLESQLLDALDRHLTAQHMLSPRRRMDEALQAMMQELLELTRLGMQAQAERDAAQAARNEAQADNVSKLTEAVRTLAERRKSPWELLVEGIRYAAQNPSTAAVVVGFISTVVLILQSAGVLPTIATLVAKGRP